jgi:hypothetical protein
MAESAAYRMVVGLSLRKTPEMAFPEGFFVVEQRGEPWNLVRVAFLASGAAALPVTFGLLTLCQAAEKPLIKQSVLPVQQQCHRLFATTALCAVLCAVLLPMPTALVDRPNGSIRAGRRVARLARAAVGGYSP